MCEINDCVLSAGAILIYTSKVSASGSAAAIGDTIYLCLQKSPAICHPLGHIWFLQGPDMSIIMRTRWVSILLHPLDHISAIL